MKSKPASTPQQKVDWLLSHRDLWVVLGPYQFSDPRFAIIRNRMLDAGLYSALTYKADIDRSLGKYIDLARKQRREQSSKRRKTIPLGEYELQGKN